MNLGTKLQRLRNAQFTRLRGTRSKTIFNLCVVGLVSTVSLLGQTNVVTQHNDIGRTGQNLTETILTLANVNNKQFGKLFTLNVDGQVIAQPLYMSSVTISGTVHHVLFVATEHDSVYAFDAFSGIALWQARMLDASHGAVIGATPVPISDPDCDDISKISGAEEYGITGTPVIDVATGTLYVVSKTFEGSQAVERLHALDVTTGNERLGGPVKIFGSVAGTGQTIMPKTAEEASMLSPAQCTSGIIAFDPRYTNQRAGLLEVNGNIYIAFGSHCDHPGARKCGDTLQLTHQIPIFHGWIFGFNAKTLVQTAMFIPSPNGYASGIWMSGTGLAADTLAGVSRIFPATGNGLFDAKPPYGTNNMDYGDDILRLTVASNGALKVADAFTPCNQANLNGSDADLGSGGVLLLPDQPGPHPHLLAQLGKTPDLYLLDRDNLGGSCPPPNMAQPVPTDGLWGAPAYWNGHVYVWPKRGNLTRYTIIDGHGQLASLGLSGISSQSEPGAWGSTPSISANGTQDGIVWSVDYSKSPQVVYAHNAADVSQMLWSSAQNEDFDDGGYPQKFGVPTIADGQVFVGAVNQVEVYGLIPPLAGSMSTGSVFFGNYAWTFPIKLTDLPKRTAARMSNDKLGPLLRIKTSLSGANPDNFFTYSDCANGFLQRGQTCSIFAVFNPQTKGNFNATLTVTASSGNGSVNVNTVSLRGTGLGPK